MNIFLSTPVVECSGSHPSFQARRTMLLDYMGSLLVNEPNHFPILTSRPGRPIAGREAREAVSHPKPSENSQRCHTPIDYPNNYMHVFGKNNTFFFVLQIAYLSPSCASLSNGSPGVLAMRENEFMATRGFVSVTLSRLSSEDALILSRRTIPNIPKGLALPEV